MPIPLDFECDMDGLKIYNPDKEPLLKYSWKKVHKEFVEESDMRVEDFIYKVRLDIARSGVLPLIKYRKLQERELTTDEAVSALLKGNVKDEDMYVSEVSKEKTFVLLEIDVRRGTVTLQGPEEKLLFRHPLTSVLKAKVQKNEPPEELGLFFFKRAKLLRKL